MKAWRVALNDCDTVYVLANTRARAISDAIDELDDVGGDTEWHREHRGEINAEYIPSLDGDTITEQQLLEGGHMGWSECPCGKGVTMEDGPVFDDQGRAYCSEACREHPMPTWTGQSEVWFLSTEY